MPSFGPISGAPVGGEYQNGTSPPAPTVTSVTISPANPVATGGTVQLSASVQGNNNPSQAVAWYKRSGYGSVNSSGAVAGSLQSSQQTGVYYAVSVQDGTTASDDVTVTFPAAVVTPPAGDTTRPIMVGEVSATATATTITASVPAATDNVAIKEYKWRINGGPEVSTGLTRTKNYTGLTPETPYNVEVLAYDTSDNPAIAPLIVDVVTLAASTQPDLVEKVLTITLKTKNLALRPNVSGIYWEWSDARGVVTSSGGGLAANGLAQIQVPIRTALLSDGEGFLSLDNYSGGNPLDYFAFRGPVRVP